MLTKFVVVAIWLISRLLVSNAAVDCKKRLSFNSIKDCCTLPSFNFEPFRSSCAKYMPENGSPGSPCLFDCVFSAGKALNGTKLNVENTRQMFDQLLDKHKDFVPVYTQALQNCTAVESKIAKYKRRGFYGYENCSTLPIFLFICTVKNSFVNCPTASWKHGSEACDEYQAYTVKCKCGYGARACSTKLKTF